MTITIRLPDVVAVMLPEVKRANNKDRGFEELLCSLLEMSIRTFSFRSLTVLFT